MEFRNLFNVNNGAKCACPAALPRAARTAHRPDMYAPHSMPRILSEDVGAPELRTAHAMAATRMRRDRRA